MKKAISIIAAAAIFASLFCGCAEKGPGAGDASEEVSVSETTSEGLYDALGVYMYAPDGSENISYALVDMGGGVTAAQMKFSAGGADFTYRAAPRDGAPEDGCAYLSVMSGKGSERGTANISGITADTEFTAGGEGCVYWYDEAAGMACCVTMSASASEQLLMIYGNTLYAFLHSDLMD